MIPTISCEHVLTVGSWRISEFELDTRILDVLFCYCSEFHSRISF